MNFDHFDQCIVCGSRSLKPLQGYSKDFLHKCSSCSFVFAARIPSENELIAHYNTYPRTNSISTITIQRYNEILDNLEVYRKTNNLIDVGCGDGFFLETAKKRGWNVFGTEYTDTAVAICRKKGIEMQQGKLNPNQYADGFFDVVASFEVLEHINNPNEELGYFSKILRNGGAVYLTTPNFNSLSRYLLGNQWSIIEYPEHLSYYTRKTLKSLFVKHGFAVYKIDTTGLSLNRILSSIRKKRAEQVNSSVPPPNHDEAFRARSERSFWLRWAKNTTNYILTILGIGDSLKATFIKK